MTGNNDVATLRDNHAEAVPAFRRAIELDPENAIVFRIVLEELRNLLGNLGNGGAEPFTLGVSLAEQGKHGEA